MAIIPSPSHFRIFWVYIIQPMQLIGAYNSELDTDANNNEGIFTNGL